MQTIVVSATNLFLGGPLTVARELLAALRASERFTRGDFRVIVFCHRRELYCDIAPHPNLEWIELPHVRRNWLVRLYYEYVWFARWSRGREIDVWISLQDLTPNVRAKRRIVYCHNPAPFYDGPHRWLLDPRFEVFRLLYGFFYRVNLAKNDFVIVQQQWMRDEMERRYGRGRDRTIVAHPVLARPSPFVNGEKVPKADEGSFSPAAKRILYPVYPRSAKNHELLIAAMRELRDLPIELTLTFAGNETRYARMIHHRSRGLENIRFTGFLTLAELEVEYARADALVFPSKLETWGLPLSEFRTHGKPIFAANLPYAHEALGGYPRSIFFDPDSSADLVKLLRRFHQGESLPYETPPAHTAPPFAADWNELIAMLW
ncbi:MAG TPA: glycosyltransferase [Thermoanaerobaculia bacterium]|jgi:glycosyltransferase involved in cell wall biosynthesis|nr:glycosyltransferase [Thermoanaerobaculia bacterium]